MDAVEIASLFGVLALKDTFSPGLDAAEAKAKGFGERISAIGDDITKIGGSITALTAPFVTGLGLATKSALDFDSSLTNVQSVTGATDEQIALMSSSVLQLGMNSRQGSQAAADAMYDIAGGVADASTHMDILSTSLDVATAGSASLDGVVNTMIKTMNIYGLSADKASHAGDVFTRTVGMGVGTANEFASALPPVEGLGKELGLTFDELGGYMAYMSTKSESVAAGGTQLKGVFSKLINPSDDLNKAIKAMGYESGAAMVKQEGLVGALSKIKEFGGGSFSGLITDQEALLGALALTSDGADEFFTTFEDGIDGATAKAKAIQMSSPAAQIDLLTSRLQGLGIIIGQAVLPALGDLAEAAQPIITAIAEWVQANPELVQQIAGVVTVVGALGVGLTALGLAISVIGGAFTALTSPIGIALIAGAALVAAYTSNFGGLRDFIDNEVRPRLDDFFKALGNAWETVKPGLEAIYNWFTTDGLPTIKSTVEDVWNNIITPFFNFIGDVWTTVSTGLDSLYNWFVTDGLPTIRTTVEDIWNNVISPFITTIADIWTTVQPALQAVYDWFVTDGLPTIRDIIDGLVTITLQPFINLIQGIWDTVSPGLDDFKNWFTTDGLPIVKTIIDDVKTKVDTFISLFSNLWNSVKGGVEAFADNINSFLQPVQDVLDSIAGAIEDVKKAMQGDSYTVSTTPIPGGASLAPDQAGLDAFYASQGQSRDSGGHGNAGQPYYIGTGAQPELFIPKTDGMFIPRDQQASMNGISVGQLIINANSEAEGRAAYDGFEQRFRERQGARG